MHYLYYIFCRFYTSIPIKTSKENIEVSTMSGLCITLLFNVLAVVEVICQGLEIKISRDHVGCLFDHHPINDSSFRELLYRGKNRNYNGGIQRV